MAYFNYQGKNIFYREVGKGRPLLLLHGNTASSKMFDDVLQLYTEKNKVILIDFIGHGASDRIAQFPPNIWFDEALQTIALIEHLKYGKVNIIGSSGGAIVALNIALEKPQLVDKIIADSFEGEFPLSSYMDIVEEDRKNSKDNIDSVTFWRSQHGHDWQHIVDCDTKATLEFYESGQSFFSKDLSLLCMPILLTGSRKDEFVFDEAFFEKTYQKLIKKIRQGKVYIYEDGGHPAMISNDIVFAQKANDFFIIN